MAAYFIQYTYRSYSARDIRYKDNLIIDYEKFEKVDSKSFYQKFAEKVKQKYSYDCDPEITSVVKL